MVGFPVVFEEAKGPSLALRALPSLACLFTVCVWELVTACVKEAFEVIFFPPPPVWLGGCYFKPVDLWELVGCSVILPLKPGRGERLFSVP